MSASGTLLEGILGIQRIEVPADREALKGLGQSLVEVGHFHLVDPGGTAAVRLQFTQLCDVGSIPVAKAPLEGFSTAVNEHTLLVHTRGLEQGAGCLALETVFKLKERRFDGEGILILLLQLLIYLM